MQTRHTPARKHRTGLSLSAAAVLVSAAIVMSVFSGTARAKVYIDITSPFDRRLPIAVSAFVADPGLSEIVRDDLNFTYVFSVIDPEGYLEPAAYPFDPVNWTPLGAEAVVKGAVRAEGRNLVVEVSLYDPVENLRLFRKEYRASRDLMRSLAHSIAGDVYEALTRQPPIFRTRLAYTAPAGDHREIFFMDWDGHRSRRITFRNSLTKVPRWSNRGQFLAYASVRKNRWGIYLLDLRNMTERRLVAKPGLNLPGDFLPDDRSLLYSTSADGNPDLHRRNLLGSGDKRLTRTPGIDVSPSLNPSGTAFVFVSDRSGGPQLYVQPVDGGRARRISFGGNYNTAPDWSPTGDRIAFVGRKDGSLHIFTMKPDGTDRKQLTFHGTNDSPSWSPDGRYIAFASRRDGTTGIYVMLADGHGKRRLTPKDKEADSPRWSPYLRF